MNLSSMLISACNENKLEKTEVIKLLAEEMEETKEFGEVFEELYKKAYGNSISKDLAESIVRSFAVTDDSERADGQMWTMEQTTSVGNDIGIDWNMIPKYNFYVVMNMARSDAMGLAKKLEMEDDPKYFAYWAKDWLCDKDAPADKLYRYIFHVIM